MMVNSTVSVFPTLGRVVPVFEKCTDGPLLVGAGRRVVRCVPTPTRGSSLSSRLLDCRTQPEAKGCVRVRVCCSKHYVDAPTPRVILINATISRHRIHAHTSIPLDVYLPCSCVFMCVRESLAYVLTRGYDCADCAPTGIPDAAGEEEEEPRGFARADC
eukprot:230307-Prorocentrum_minimum.AAC.1